MSTFKYALPSLLSIVLIPAFMFAQGSNETYHDTENPKIFKNDNGATIEYIGLKEWTAQQVQDSLKSLAPNRPVSACVAILKNKLGFEDADVEIFTKITEEGKRMPPYTIVSLVEPNSTNEINTWRIPSNKNPINEKWTGDYDLSDSKIRDQIIYSSQFLRKQSGEVVVWPRVMKSSMFSEEEKRFLKKFYGNISKRDSESDYAQAHQTLDSDGNISNRILASLVLLNFQGDEKGFYAMLNQIRSESDELNIFSSRILNAMARNSPKIDWSGAKESIKAILSGTSIKEFSEVLEVLTATKISPELSGDVLPSNTFLLEEYLQSSYSDTKSTGLAFVEQISGQKFDNSTAAIEWLSKFE